MNSLWTKWSSVSLVARIIVGVIVGIVLGVTLGDKVAFVAMFGDLFVAALKGVAPLLVFLLVMSSIAMHKSGKKTNMKYIIFLYFVSTFVAALVAVVASFAFPTILQLTGDAATGYTPPEGVYEVLKGLLLNVVDNPIKALYNANYIGVLAASVLLGIALKDSASETTKTAISDFSDAVSKIVKWVIELAPFGIMGLVYATAADGGVEALSDYGRIIIVLVSSMLFVAFVTNPLIVYLNTKTNPYPLVFKCLRESGITAFFTRSSAANIPVNMQLCEDLGLDKDTYSVSIPLGATINMAGAAITINILTLAAANTLGIQVDFAMALLLSIVASISACGVSGIAGGSILLIPLACSLFGIPDDISMQVVGVGFVVGVIQDSCETALNSSTDVLLTATADVRARIKNGETVKSLVNNQSDLEKLNV